MNIPIIHSDVIEFVVSYNLLLIINSGALSGISSTKIKYKTVSIEIK